MARELVARGGVRLALYPIGTRTVRPGYNQEKTFSIGCLRGDRGSVLSLPGRKSQVWVARVHDSSASDRSKRRRPLSPVGDSVWLLLVPIVTVLGWVASIVMGE